ncbi:hypothetical protein [Leifsonia naganoensis]|uniref:Uncharacterized protein n=1 Tax=Leifsonia naganoensis TaxID=150025 RepID=A0A853DR42_9MICO|nr:hypothetical protein [Leifsonia naganoensis]NYK08570.1 hypothetical protein [Leifsonia naganoensis]
MSEGPTTAGSIVGKLKLDSSDWMEKLAAAEAAARKLGSADPNVKVDVDSATAMAKLAAVEEQVKRLAEQNDKLRASQTAVNNTNGNGVQRWQLIAAAIAALIPLLAPLAAYVVGVGGALAGMGAAGALAIYGIVRAIKDGTVVGAQYQRGLDQLKGTLDRLGSTAAVRMLGAFHEAVSTINMALPQLNNQIGVFSGYAGRIGNTVLQGVINALQVLNPLFVQGAGYVAQLASGFEAWTANGGLEKFTAYAMQVFPQVADTLGSLASLGMHVAEAFSTWGGPMLGALKGVADALNAIPAGILPALTVGAVGVVLAFKGWSAIRGSIDGVTGSLNMTQGAGKAAFATLLQGIAAVDASILSMTASITSGIKQWQGLTQSQDKWSASVRAGKINTADLGKTLQATGGFWNDFMNNIDIAGTAVRPFYDNVKALDQAIASATPADAAVAYKQLQQQMKAAGKTSEDMATMFPAATAAIHAQQEASKEAANAAKDNASGLDASADSAKKTQDAMTKLNETLKGLGSAQLDASSSNIAFQQSIADATAAVKQNGATLDLNSQQGRDNQKALDGIASSAIQMVAAAQQAGVGTGDLTQKMGAARQSFIDAAVQMGVNAEQAGKMADQYGLVPSNVSTAFTTSGAAAAAATAASLQAAYNALQGVYTIRVNTIVQRSQLPDLNGADSGTGRMGTYRDGGTIHAATGLTVPGGGSPHVDSVRALLAPTEEVISNRMGQASNNRGLLKLVNSGANANQIADYAGARAGRGVAPSVTNVTHNHTWNVTANDPTELTQKVALRLVSRKA